MTPQSFKLLLHCWQHEACQHSAFWVLQETPSSDCQVSLNSLSGSRLDDLLVVICHVYIRNYSRRTSKPLGEVIWRRHQWGLCAKGSSPWNDCKKIMTETQGGTKTVMCFCFLYSTDKNLSQKKEEQWATSTWSLRPKVLLVVKYAEQVPQIQCWAMGQVQSNKELCHSVWLPLVEKKAGGTDSKMKLRKEMFNKALLTSIESTVQPKETRPF